MISVAAIDHEARRRGQCILVGFDHRLKVWGPNRLKDRKAIAAALKGREGEMIRFLTMRVLREDG
jgi:hypothetical protein